ncbi:hypothetical protein GCM10027517_32180 [Phycicoccus ginsengisoli]
MTQHGGGLAQAEHDDPGRDQLGRHGRAPRRGRRERHEQDQHRPPADDGQRRDHPLLAAVARVAGQDPEQVQGCEGPQHRADDGRRRAVGRPDEREHRRGDPAGGAHPAGDDPPVAHEERPLAEQRVTAHVAEVLEQDPPDEPDVERPEEGQVDGAHRAPRGEQPQQVGRRDVERRQRERRERAPFGQAHWAGGVCRAHGQAGGRHQGRAGAEPCRGTERPDERGGGDRAQLRTVDPTADQHPARVVREVDGVDAGVGQVVDDSRVDQERHEHEHHPQQGPRRGGAGHGESARGIQHQEQEHGRADHRPRDPRVRRHLLLP